MKTSRQSLTIFFLVLFVCVMGATGASGADYEGVKAAQIKRTTTASNGQKLHT